MSYVTMSCGAASFEDEYSHVGGSSMQVNIDEEMCCFIYSSQLYDVHTSYISLHLLIQMYKRRIFTVIMKCDESTYQGVLICCFFVCLFFFYQLKKDQTKSVGQKCTFMLIKMLIVTYTFVRLDCF